MLSRLRVALDVLLESSKRKKGSFSASKIKDVAKLAVQLSSTKAEDVVLEMVNFVRTTKNHEKLLSMYTIDAILRLEQKKEGSVLRRGMESEILALCSFLDIEDAKLKKQVSKVLDGWQRKHLFEAALLRRCAVAAKVNVSRSSSKKDPLVAPLAMPPQAMPPQAQLDLQPAPPMTETVVMPMAPTPEVVQQAPPPPPDGLATSTGWGAFLGTSVVAPVVAPMAPVESISAPQTAPSGWNTAAPPVPVDSGSASMWGNTTGASTTPGPGWNTALSPVAPSSYPPVPPSSMYPPVPPTHSHTSLPSTTQPPFPSSSGWGNNTSNTPPLPTSSAPPPLPTTSGPPPLPASSGWGNTSSAPPPLPTSTTTPSSWGEATTITASSWGEATPTTKKRASRWE